VVNGVANVDSLVLKSDNLQLTAHGTVGMDQKLALQARLTVNQSIINRLPSLILPYFRAGETKDTMYIDFEIGNTLSNPKTHLIEKIQGLRINGQMMDMLNNIFGKKHKKTAPVEPPP
jgi:hypothetical protein